MNNDVAIEILLHLPVKSVLRFRAVCKFWGDVIDSPSFRKLHNNEDDTVYLQFTVLDNQDEELPIKLVDNGKSFKLYNDFYDRFSAMGVGAVKGLISMSCRNNIHHSSPIAICNPFLGQFKILPKSPHLNSCSIFTRDFGIGFDGDYKVVELLSCLTHGQLHAHLYSRRADSWRDLGDVLDRVLFIERPIKSSCKNGYFAHWRGFRFMEESTLEEFIISFDMKSEVFRVFTLPVCTGMMLEYSSKTEILAKDECSFILLARALVSNVVRVYESRFEDSKLLWNHVMDITQRPCGMPLARSDCVVLRNFYGDNEFIFYDHRARKFVGILELQESSKIVEIVEYKGSLISP